MSRDDRVYLSAMMMNSGLVTYFIPEGFEENKEEILDAMRRHQNGETLTRDQFPERLIYRYPDATYRRKTEVMKAGDFWVVSARVAKILSQFDLGEGGFYPVELCQYKRKTLVSGDWFCWNFGARKEAFLPAQSRNMQRPYADRDIWRPGFVMENGDPAVSRAALEGADLWIDPKVWTGMFMSGAMRDALKAAKLTRYFRWTECRMI